LKEEIIKVLHAERNLCMELKRTHCGTQIRNSCDVLKNAQEMEGESPLHRSCEKWRSTCIAKSQGGQEYPTYKKRRKLTRLVTSCVETAIYNVLLKENKKGRETEEVDISSYWMTLRK